MYSVNRTLFVLLPLSLILLSQASRMSQNRRNVIGGHDCTQSTRRVSILVTRHGLSCANLIDKFTRGPFKGVQSKMHAFMKDPLLSAAGVVMTKAAQGEVSEWLEMKRKEDPSLKLDAVLASHLARAWETASLQFPGFSVEGVPYISESGAGLDNTPRKSDDQTALVEKEIKESGSEADFRVNLKWLRKYGQNTKGDWAAFRDEFLAKDYLPYFATVIKKPANESILLAAVTHSNFMNEGELKNKCIEKYPIDSKSKKRKANNNQVVLMQYLWETTTCGPPDNRTTTYSLEDDGQPCELVATGTSIYDANGAPKPLCYKDLGAQCQEEFKAARAWAPPTLESDMKTRDTEFTKKRNQLANAESMNHQLHDWRENAKKEAKDDPSDMKKAKAFESLQRKIQKNKELRGKLFVQMAKIDQDFKALESQQCWLGGNPEYKSDVLSSPKD